MTDRRYAKPSAAAGTARGQADRAQHDTLAHNAGAGGAEADGRGHYASPNERSHGRDHASLSRRYIAGFMISLLLVAVAFSVAVLTDWGFGRKLTVIGASAISQIAAQFYFFLHIDLTRQRREDLQLILFTFLLLVIMCGGTIWILGNLATRM